jgi:hypothetical protein
MVHGNRQAKQVLADTLKARYAETKHQLELQL